MVDEPKYMTVEVIPYPEVLSQTPWLHVAANAMKRNSAKCRNAEMQKRRYADSLIQYPALPFNYLRRNIR